MTLFAQILHIVNKDLVSILLFVVADSLSVVFQLLLVIIITSWTRRSLLLLFGLVEYLTCYSESLIDRHFGALKLGILVPVVILMVLRAAANPGLVFLFLRGEEHSLILGDNLIMELDAIVDLRLRVVHGHAELGSRTQLLLHYYLEVGKLFNCALFDGRPGDILLIAACRTLRYAAYRVGIVAASERAAGRRDCLKIHLGRD